MVVDTELELGAGVNSDEVLTGPIKGGDEINADVSNFTSVTPILETHQVQEDEQAIDTVRRHIEEIIEDPREARMNAEREIVQADPENVGMVIDHEFIINPWKVDLSKRVDIAMGVYGATDSDIEVRKKDPAVIAQVLADQSAELAKVDQLREYLEGFEGKIEHVRVHPPGEVSPLSLGAAVQHIDGNRTISLPPEYVEQIRMIQEHAEDVTLVIQFFDHNNGPDNASPIPTGKAVEDYIALCKHVVDTFGPHVSLEFGVEPNISRETDLAFEKSLQYLPNASEVDPRKYGDFYAQVAAAIKKDSPDVRCIPAGTAFLDGGFTRDMLQEIMDYEDGQGIERGTLVDGLSFHPYRDGQASEACLEIVDGQFAGIIQGSYEDQLAIMRNIAESYRAGLPLRLGEFNFQNSDAGWKTKLNESIDITTQAGALTYIYPGFKPWN